MAGTHHRCFTGILVDGPLIKVRVVTIDYGCLHRSAAEKFRRLHDRLS